MTMKNAKKAIIGRLENLVKLNRNAANAAAEKGDTQWEEYHENRAHAYDMAIKIINEECEKEETEKEETEQEEAAIAALALKAYELYKKLEKMTDETEER